MGRSIDQMDSMSAEQSKATGISCPSPTQPIKMYITQPCLSKKEEGAARHASRTAPKGTRYEGRFGGKDAVARLARKRLKMLENICA